MINPNADNQVNQQNEEIAESANIMYNDINSQNTPVQSSKFYEGQYDKNDPISKESSNKVKFTEKEYKDKYYICEECGSFPLINIINDRLIKITCKKHNKEIEFDEFIKKIYNNKIDINKFKKCETHKKELIKACIKCNINLCENCKHQDDKENHLIKTFEELAKEMNYIVSFLENYIYNKYNFQKNQIISDDKTFREGLKSEIQNQHKTETSFDFIQNSKELIYTIIADSKNCPNYIHYKNLKYLNSY